MKKITSLFGVAILFLIFAGFTACEKDKTDPPPASAPSIVGYWEARYNWAGTDYPPVGDGGYLMRANGSMAFYNNFDTTRANTIRSEGTYTLNGSAISINYSVPDGSSTAGYALSGQVSSNFVFMDGTLTRTRTSGTTSGYFIGIKQ